MTNLTEFTFLSSDGKTRLHAMQWLPEGTPRAVLQISHGVAEHIGRYDGFARYLNEQGLAVVGHDHLGHGGSLPEGGTPVYFGDGTPWETVVADIQLLHEQLRREFSCTIVYVTHDQEEALTLSDRVMVMGGGRIRQIDTPENLLRRPADAYVREFVGENLLRRQKALERFFRPSEDA